MVGRVLAVGFLCAGVSVGQVAPPTADVGAAKVVAPAVKSLAFDIVSIRQNVSQPSVPMMGPPQFGPTADGYRAMSMPLTLPLMTAFVPSIGGAAFFTQDRVVGLPDWAQRERYDIDAKVSAEDMAEWQKPGSQLAMLQAMLRAMLEERCKLAVHREVKEVAVYSMVVGKNGPKFKETDPAVEHPGGMKLPWGGVLVPGNGTMNMYGVSMASVAALLGELLGNMGRPVQDRTGLTGRYDIVMKPTQGGGAGDAGGGAGGGMAGPAASDPGSAMFSAIQDQLGLKLEPGKANVETLVIDHMERPSAN